MPKIRVAFFAEILIEELDGATRTMFQLINKIPAEKFEFLFICGTAQESVAVHQLLQVPSITIPINASYQIALPGLVKEKITAKIKAFNPHVIHIATPSLLGMFAIKYARKNNIPVMSIYHTHFISYVDYYLKKVPCFIDVVKSKISVAQKKFYNNCDITYVPSESIMNELAQMNIDISRMKIWKRGINTSLFSPQKKDLAYIRSLTGNSQPNILFASRLVWEKNLDTLIKVYELCEQKKKGYNFIIAGDGTARKFCAQKMKNAVFTGKINHTQLSVLYASSDIFLFPSISETYGNVVLEAMASGLPCIIADKGGQVDFIQHGINGFKCKAFDEYDFLDKIETLLSSALLQRQFSQNSLLRSKSFDWNELTNTYFEDVRFLAEPVVKATAHLPAYEAL